MSQENIPLVSRERFQALLDAMNARDFEAVAKLVGSEIRFRSALWQLAAFSDPREALEAAGLSE
jgi:hypothetical protein